MIIYEYDYNHIHEEPIKYRTAAYLTKENKKFHKMFTSRGLQPKMHILDHECSNMFNNFMIKVDKKFQFVPTNLHRRNAAEREIQTFKNKLISGISSFKKYSTMHLWC